MIRQKFKRDEMIMETTLAAIADLLKTTTETPDIEITGISTDTRTLQSGNLFVAVSGTKFDGNTFAAEASQKGAVAALVSKKQDISLPQIVVDDTVTALGQIAMNWRQRFDLPLIAVTGSCGKTTVKNMIQSILLAACNGNANQVFATVGNLNNHIGLPLTLCQLTSEHRYGVIEMGMNHAGEIAYLSRMAQPTVAVITNAGAAHLAGLKTVEGIAQAKGEIFLGLARKGIGILNYDDLYFQLWQDLLDSRDHLTFGLDYVADITATIPSIAHHSHQNFALQTPLGEIAVRLPMPGRHNIMNALAATAAAIAVDIELPAIKKGLENTPSTPGRLHIQELAPGLRLIDDSYNAIPDAVNAAALTLAAQPGMKIFVLGDMKELGPEAEQIHFTTGQNIKKAGVDLLFTCGSDSQAAAKGFGTDAQHFNDQETLVHALKRYLKPTTTILVKGSRSMRMEQVVVKLKENITA